MNESLAEQGVTEHPTCGSPGTANYIDARTTWFDQAVQGAKLSGLSQVVIIAAGFDSRAYRLHSPGVQVNIVAFGMLQHVPYPRQIWLMLFSCKLVW